MRISLSVSLNISLPLFRTLTEFGRGKSRVTDGTSFPSQVTPPSQNEFTGQVSSPWRTTVGKKFHLNNNNERDNLRKDMRERNEGKDIKYVIQEALGSHTWGWLPLVLVTTRAPLLPFRPARRLPRQGLPLVRGRAGLRASSSGKWLTAYIYLPLAAHALSIVVGYEWYNDETPSCTTSTSLSPFSVLFASQTPHHHPLLVIARRIFACHW